MMDKEEIMSSKMTMRIINYLYLNPESSSIKIIRTLKMNLGTVSKVIYKLREYNLIITFGKRKGSREIPLSLNQEGMEIGKLINQLIFKLKE